MVEGYLAGILLVSAGIFWSKKLKAAPVLMVAAWAYAMGGMFVPFYAHLEAYLRVETFRADHPHTDLESVITKGIVWAICLTCLVITIRSNEIREVGK